MRMTMAGLLAASTLVLAQDNPPPPAANTPVTQTDSSGGWKRVGDQSQAAQMSAQNNGYGPTASPNMAQYPAPNTGPSQPPPTGQYGPAPVNGQYGAGNSPYGAAGNEQRQNVPQANYAPPAPVPAQLTMPAGTFLTVRINQMLSSDKNQPGDAFTASLVQPVVVNGVVIAEPGQTIGGRVVTAEKHHVDQPARLGVQLISLSLVDGQQAPIATQFVSRQGGTTPRGTEVGTVAATTGVGATIGAIAGWGTGAAIGAGAGAAAGLIGVLVTHHHASVLYPEQILTFRVETPVTISTVNSAQAFRYVEPNEYDRPTYANYGSGGLYQSAAPAPPVYNNYAYGAYPYGGWGYPYPYFGGFYGPSIAFYGGFGRGYYGRPYYGRGYYGGYHGFAGGRGGFRR